MSRAVRAIAKGSEGGKAENAMPEYEMPDATELELYRTLRSSQDKFCYFMMTSAGTSVGFALTQTRTAEWHYSLLALLLAASCWVGSFYYGCRNTLMGNATIFANVAMLQFGRGAGGASANVAERAAQIQGASQVAYKNADMAAKYSKRQFRLLILGVVFYIFWHGSEMYNAAQLPSAVR